MTSLFISCHIIIIQLERSWPNFSVDIGLGSMSRWRDRKRDGQQHSWLPLKTVSGRMFFPEENIREVMKRWVFGDLKFSESGLKISINS